MFSCKAPDMFCVLKIWTFHWGQLMKHEKRHSDSAPFTLVLSQHVKNVAGILCEYFPWFYIQISFVSHRGKLKVIRCFRRSNEKVKCCSYLFVYLSLLKSLMELQTEASDSQLWFAENVNTEMSRNRSNTIGSGGSPKICAFLTNVKQPLVSDPPGQVTHGSLFVRAHF